MGILRFWRSKINNQGLESFLLELDVADMNHETQTLNFDESVIFESPSKAECIRAADIRKRYADIEEAEYIEAHTL